MQVSAGEEVSGGGGGGGGEEVEAVIVGEVADMTHLTSWPSCLNGTVKVVDFSAFFFPCPCTVSLKVVSPLQSREQHAGVEGGGR